MSLRPTEIAQEKHGAKGLFAAIDDPETVGVLLLPCSFAHRRVVARDELESDYELHPARSFSDDDLQLLHHAVSMAVTLYDAVEGEDGVPEDAPLYGKRDRLVELGRRLDHEANCLLSQNPGGGK